MKKPLYIADWKPDSDKRDAVIYTIEPNELDSLEGVQKLDPEAADVDPILAPLLSLIKLDVSFAAVPESFGEGSACYLINLTSLKED